MSFDRVGPFPIPTCVQEHPIFPPNLKLRANFCGQENVYSRHYADRQTDTPKLIHNLILMKNSFLDRRCFLLGIPNILTKWIHRSSLGDGYRELFFSSMQVVHAQWHWISNSITLFRNASTEENEKIACRNLQKRQQNLLLKVWSPRNTLPNIVLQLTC